MEEIKSNTKKRPTWIHFGGGNLYRGFHAQIANDLLNKKIADTGVIVAETYDKEVIDKIYRPYDNRFLQIIMKSDGTLEKNLITSTTDSYYVNSSNSEDWEKVVDIFENPSLQLATFSITEKAYKLHDINGDMLSVVVEDIKNGPVAPKHTISQIVYFLLQRFNKNAKPIAMVSTDNFSQNGKQFWESVMKIAEGWKKNGFVTNQFIEYLTDDRLVSFPWSMIDRITPNPSSKIAKLLEESGFEDTTILHSKKHTNIAPFANTEEAHYLVIEDKFPNGRPIFEKVGVIMTDRDTVDKADRMKVTTCLNPLHTALAIFGCLLGYESIATEMEDPDLLTLVQQIGYKEGLPVVVNPEIINPKMFIDEVILKRLPNKYIPDTPQRIATDTSQKIAIRFGETIKNMLKAMIYLLKC
ncbi:mannitol dehydrogenase family protein [Paenibacillus larvae]